jgi:hypothetical protein
MSHHHRKHFQKALWGAPIALGLISVLGLWSALIGDGWWDVVSWVCLGLVAAVCLWFGLVAKPRRH